MEALAKEFIAVLTAVRAEASAVVGAVAPSDVKPKVRCPPKRHTPSPHQAVHCYVWTATCTATTPHGPDVEP